MDRIVSIDPTAIQDWSDALREVYGLNETEKELFVLLLTAGRPLTVDELASTLDRDRTTVYRYVKRLSREGLVEKESVPTDGGGYCHAYYPRDPATLASEMRRRTNDLYTKLDELVREFREKYESKDDHIELSTRMPSRKPR